MDTIVRAVDGTMQWVGRMLWHVATRDPEINPSKDRSSKHSALDARTLRFR